MTVPSVFYFTCKYDHPPHSTEYLAEKQEGSCDGLWDIMWMDEEDIHFASYPEDEIADCLNNGDWLEVV